VPDETQGKGGRNESLEPEESVELFNWRREQFERFRHSNEGITPTQARTHALLAAARLGEPPYETVDFLEEAPREPVEVDLADGSLGTAHTTDHPLPEAGFGFVGPAVHVVASPDMTDAVLKVALPPETLERVFVETIHVLRFDSDANAWRLVPRSGVAQSATHAWAFVTDSGIYAAAGIVNDHDRLVALVLSYEAKPVIDAIRAPDQPLGDVLREATAERALSRLLPERDGTPEAPDEREELRAAGLDRERLELLGRHAGSLDSLDPGGGDPVEWQIFDALMTTERGRATLERLDELAEEAIR
jgi:hypothetical protein